MDCENNVRYTIRQGDNLYQLARYFRTDVPSILAMNPSLDPYRLRIGSILDICPGEGFVLHNATTSTPAYPDPSKLIRLINEMHLVWEQHVYWTRMAIISIAQQLRDQPQTIGRLLQNPGDLERIFALYYPSETARMIADLFTEHLEIGAALVTALRDGKEAEAAELNKKWYENADEIAQTLSTANPYYDRKELQDMLYRHLDLTSQEAGMRLSGNYNADIDAFDMAEEEILAMADYLVRGIVKQFPQKF